MPQDRRFELDGPVDPFQEAQIEAEKKRGFRAFNPADVSPGQDEQGLLMNLLAKLFGGNDPMAIHQSNMQGMQTPEGAENFALQQILQNQGGILK